MSDKTDANDAKEQAFDKFFSQVDYWAKVHGFNEAAGIHRRKLLLIHLLHLFFLFRFNEAAGIHRRKRRSTDLP